ncbi:MAG TPA: hypothetical protein VGF55_25425 [Gemmataceae bacterium]|jgi:hypothetical protein
MRGRPPLRLDGIRWGRLTPVRRIGRKNGCVVWLCRCECGNTAEVRASALASGVTRSCGCLRREMTGERFRAKPASRGELYLRMRANGWTVRQIAWLCGVTVQAVSQGCRRAAARRDGSPA